MKKLFTYIQCISDIDAVLIYLECDKSNGANLILKIELFIIFKSFTIFDNKINFYSTPVTNTHTSYRKSKNLCIIFKIFLKIVKKHCTMQKGNLELH